MRNIKQILIIEMKNQKKYKLKPQETQKIKKEETQTYNIQKVQLKMKTTKSTQKTIIRLQEVEEVLGGGGR